MSYIFLTLILLIMAIVSYYILKKEIISPTVITCLIFAISALGAFFGTAKNSWNFIDDINFNTIWFIILGIISFFIGEWIARKIRFKSRKANKNIEEKEFKYIRIGKIKKMILISCGVLTFLLLYLNMRSITGGGSLSEIISKYKASSLLYNKNALEEGKNLSFIALNMLRLCEMFSVTYIYIIIKNLIHKDKIKNNLFLIFILILYIYISMMTGGRAILLKYCMAGFVIWTIIYTKSKKITLMRFFKIGTKIAVIFIPLCYFALPILGGKNDSDFIDYISFYIGSEIPAFNEFLSEPIISSEHFGEKTLKGPQMFLNKFGLADYWTAYQSEWIWFTPSLSTNTYTEFKPYIEDFGIYGLIICPFIFGFIFTKLYLFAKERRNCRYLIFYAFYSNLLIDQARINVFYNGFLSTKTIIYFILMIIITWFLFGKKKIENGEV